MIDPNPHLPDPPTEHAVPLISQTMPHLPGMNKGFVGIAGIGEPGPSIVTYTISPFKYIAIEIAWVYLHSFLGLLAVDGLGLAQLAPPGEAIAHLYTIGGIAIAPTMLSLLHELYQYLGKVRAARM